MGLGVRLSVLATLIFSLVVGCSPIELRTARQQLNTTLEQLPKLDTLIPVFSMNEDFIGTEGEFWDQCVYARTYLVYGSLSDETLVLNEYVESLEDSGWEQFDDSAVSEEVRRRHRVLQRGEQAILTVDNTRPGDLVEREFDYESIRIEYPTIITVMITYMRPQRDGC